MSYEQRQYITSRQVKAARALLDWSQEDLSAKSGLSIGTIRKIEAGHISPRGKTMEGISDAFIKADISFVGSDGVHLRTNEVYNIEGDDCFLRLTEDVYHTLKKNVGELLYMHADSSLSSETEILTQIRLRKMGVKFRILVEEGNTHLHWPINEYRWVPKKFFRYNVQAIYANKVALCMYPDEKTRIMSKAIVIENRLFADSIRNDFNFMWENCRAPTFTTAPIVYD